MIYCVVKNLDQIKKEINSYGVMCEKPVFEPLTEESSAIHFQNTNFVYNHALSIPIYPSLKEEEIDTIINHFTNIRVETAPLPGTVDSTIHKPVFFSPVTYPDLTLRIINGKIDYYEFFLSDQYLSNYVVKANTSRCKREVKAEYDASMLESKKQGGNWIKWSGGRIAETLNLDTELRKVIPIPNSCITLKPSENHVDINFKRYIWEDRLKQALPSRDEYEVFERIADHIREVTKLRIN